MKPIPFGVDGLDPTEVAYVIELLAAMATLDEIKGRFYEFTGGSKAISVKTIQTIAVKYGAQVKERTDAYLKNVEGNPLAHPRVRLDILHRIIQDALTLRPSHSIKTSDESYEVVKKADNPSAIQAIKLAMMDMAKQEELKLAHEKLKLMKTSGDVDTDDEEIEVDDGITRAS